jgi:hypothetical protein
MPISGEVHPAIFEETMRKFNYRAPAELFTGRSMRGARPMRYHRFDSGADAIRFAVETLSADQLLATVLKVDEERYRHGEIRALYESPAYPHKRPRDIEAKATAEAKKPAKSRASSRKPALKSKSAA